MIENQLETRKIFGLDLMRVAAILLVLSAHSLWIYKGYSNLLTKAMNFSGFIGVELFFVLSGYLIGGSLYRAFVRDDFGLASARRFLRRRAYRIMPNYMLVLVINLLVAWLIGYAVVDAWKYFLFIQNFAWPMLPFFPESWSMAIKEIPYIVLPFMLLLFAKWGMQNRKRLFLLFAMVFILASLIAKIIFHLNHHQHLDLAKWNISLRSVAIYRVDAVMYGVLMGWLHMNNHNFWARNKGKLLVFGVLVLAFLAVLVGVVKIPIERNPLFWNVIFLPCISLGAICTLPFFSMWIKGPLWLERPVHFLGKISYFVYLVHYSLVLFLMKYWIDTTGFGLLGLHIFTLAYLTATFALSWALHRFYERPILKIREKKT
jgi:peptidoglycan/LPS O-acetylase OafA/YrhL